MSALDCSAQVHGPLGDRITDLEVRLLDLRVDVLAMERRQLVRLIELDDLAASVGWMFHEDTGRWGPNGGAHA